MDRDHGRRLEAGAAAVLSADYQQAVQLLLRLVPTVFATDAFALKGGTAINLFLSPVSRLSVDLDLVFRHAWLTSTRPLRKCSLRTSPLGY